ncbi:Psb28 protein-domain-containing protein [Pelagophyceae sp. CCMP2097]|nr:Psb28 protein-domain-containing protein [Pelagophyceae sp. CCMP2097]
MSSVAVLLVLSALGKCSALSAPSSGGRRPAALKRGSAAPATPSSTKIQFFDGVDERVVPTIKMTRSAPRKSATDAAFFTGTATFRFDKADALFEDISIDNLIQGMRLDDEGSISTDDVRAEFERGNPVRVVAVVVLASPTAWARFMRFMKRYFFGDQLCMVDPQCFIQAHRYCLQSGLQFTPS